MRQASTFRASVARQLTMRCARHNEIHGGSAMLNHKGPASSHLAALPSRWPQGLGIAEPFSADGSEASRRRVCIIDFMVHGIRTALVWLMLLALPLHGYAGSAMLRCAEMPMPASQSSDQASVGMGLDQDGGSVLHAGMHAMPDSGTMPTSAHTSRSSTGHCTTSAACDIVAAPFPQVPAVGGSTASAALPLPLPSTGFGFFTGAPDRPPRLFA